MNCLFCRPLLAYRAWRTIVPCHGLVRHCSKSKDKSDSTGKSNSKGVRLPGATDTKNLWKTITYEYEEDLDSMVPREVDVCIIGGGIIGWSVAYFLKHHTTLSVMVVERDPSHTRCATVLGIGAIRQQFSEPENIQMSLFGAEFLRNVREHLSILDLDPPDIQFHPHGFLTLASEAGFGELKKCFEVQKMLGAKVELLSKHDIKSIWPWMEVGDLGGGIHGYENEGWFDAWQLLNAFQRKASSLGAQRVLGEVVGFEFQQGQSTDRARPGLVDRKAKNALVRLVDGNIQPVQFAFAVNAAGPWAGEIGRLLGIGDIDGPGGVLPLPVEPRVQHAFVVSPQQQQQRGAAATGGLDAPGIDCPFVVDYSGLNVRRDRLGGDFVVFLDTPPLGKRGSQRSQAPTAGRGDPAQAGLDSGLAVDWEHFERDVRALLGRRVPALGTARVRAGWAAPLDYNYVDQNLVVGRHPVLRNVLLACGSSGHGVEHAMAVGRALYELIVYTEYRSIDLANLGFERFYENTRVLEKDLF